MRHKFSPIRLYLEGFDWTGRTSRLRLFVATVILALSFVPSQIAVQFGPLERVVEIAGWVLVALVIVPYWGHVVRRLNEMRWPMWTAVFLFIPYIALVMFLILLLKGQGQRRLYEWTVFRMAGFVGAVLIALLALSRTLWAPYELVAGSMKPNLLAGDVVAVWRPAIEFERGDVIAFRHQVTGVPQIKRIVGVSGDTVQLRNGVVSINGVEAELVPQEPYVELMRPQGPSRSLPRCANGVVGIGAQCQKLSYTEILPGGDDGHVILSVRDTAPLDTTPVFTVPSGHYFVLGDNRDNSLDSRVAPAAGGMGFVSENLVIGRASLILYSFDRGRGGNSWNWAPFRLFKAIR